MSWVRKGLTTGIKTTCFPAHEETAAGVSPGLPSGCEYPHDQARGIVERCPTGAISLLDNHLAVDYRRCIHCFRCRYDTKAPIRWQEGYEWAATGGRGQRQPLERAFSRSMHILVVDAGDCGACLNEVKQLNNPYYNLHRLGFFITPTPRQADLLLVVGPGTDQMRVPLQKAYDAMSTPKRVIAVGACALSGGIFGPSFVCGPGVGDLLRIDVEVPGNPPPPLAILHGLLVAAGRKAAAPLVSLAPSAPVKA